MPLNISDVGSVYCKVGRQISDKDFLASNVNSPKGGWGYLIVICAVLVNVINQGLLLSTSLMAAIADRSFHIRGPQFGVYTGGRTNFVVIFTTNRLNLVKSSALFI